MPCDQPHHALVTGAGRMPETADGFPPAEATADDVATEVCGAAARQYHDPNFTETAALRLSWSILDGESWRAGTRTFNCMIAFYDPSGARTTVTGPHPPGGAVLT